MYNPKSYGKVAVLSGGPSSERAISIKSGRAVCEALKASGCDVEEIKLCPGTVRQAVRRSSPDIVFLALHGRFGEDGTVQKILEDMAIPYTGSGVAASRAALDKIESKRIFAEHGIPMPRYDVFNKSSAKNADGLRFPLVVKPKNEGSSIGLSLARNEKEFKNACDKAFRYSKDIIAESFIEGREITVGILGEAALPVVEVKPRGDFYDFRAKYKDKKTRYAVPAPLPRLVYKNAQALGMFAHKALRCRDFSRVDMMLADDGKIFVLEVNTIPGLTERSLLPKAAAAAGLSFNELCLKLLELAVKNKGRKE